MDVKEIDSMIEKHKQLLQEIVVSMGISTDVAVAVEEQKDAQKVSDLEKTMQDYINMEESVKRHITALTDLKRHLNQGTDKLADIFEGKLKNLEGNADPSAFKKHNKYREFKQKVWAVNHPNDAAPDEDQDLVMMQPSGDSDLICPITRKELDGPTRNQSCGHCYSNAAVMQYLSSNRGKRTIQCPVAGCNAAISKDSLEKDVEKERLLRKKHAKRKREPEKEEDTEDLTM